MMDRVTFRSTGESSIEPTISIKPTIKSDSFVKSSSIQSSNNQLPSPSRSPNQSNTSDRQSSPSCSSTSSSIDESVSNKNELSANSITSIPLNSLTARIDLEDFIKAGTIYLPNHNFTETVSEKDEDKWHILSPHLLSLEDIVMQDSTASLPTPPSSPNKGKAKAYSQDNPDLLPPEINIESTEISSFDTVSLLQKILKLQDYFMLVAEARQARFTAGVMLRIYLVPSDYQFSEEDIEKRRWSKKRPSIGALTSVISRSCSDMKEWEKAVLGGSNLKLIEYTDTRSLLEIYQAIDSPSSDPSFVDNLTGVSPTTKQRLRSTLIENPEGLETELFAYQKDSLTRMLTREIAPQELADPTYRPMLSVDGKKAYYLSPNGQPLLHPPQIVESRGGILAEEMGTGKTAICIALLLTTLGELPILSTTESRLLNGATVQHPPVLMTPLSTVFPFRKYFNENLKLRPRLAPLLENWEFTMGDLEIAQYQEQLQKQNEEDALLVKPPLPSLSNLLVNYIKTSGTRIRLNSINNMPPSVSATLESNMPYYYVHPSEAQKSSRAGRRKEFPASKIIVAPTTIVVVPTLIFDQWVVELKKHTSWRSNAVSNELRILILKHSKDKFPEVKDYDKYDLVLMSVSRFSSAAEDVGGKGEQNWLKKVHFKRLIIDEGHTMGASNSSHMRKLAAELRCQSKWAVSGTPSTHLVGKTEGEVSDLFAEAAQGGDKKDFDRLGNLFSKFLNSPAYPSVRNWTELYSTTKITNRPQLELALNAAIVRTQPEKVKESMKLPPLTTKLVELDMEEAERLTYNCILAMFVANAVTSQRTDQDYMFHERNKTFLNLIVSNLNQSSTFFSSERMQNDLRATLDNALSYVKSIEGDNANAIWSRGALTWIQKDRDALLEAVLMLQEAFRHSEWIQVVSSISPQIQVSSISKPLTQLYSGLDKEKNTTNRTLWSLGSVVALRSTVKYLLQEKTNSIDGEELEEEIITFETKKKWNLDNKVVEKIPRKKRKASAEYLPSDSTLLNVTLGATTSSKINYIINKVLTQPNEKFLIFSSANADNTLAFLSEALDLAKIRHAIFAGGARAGKVSDLSMNAVKFNTCSPEECQVLLLSVSYAARGLQLEAATRVIFLEPIWQKDLERQAIKRAHRLGQTKPVEVEILIIRHSFEDTLYKRREELRPEELAKIEAPQKDSQLKEVLQSSRYLPASNKLSGKDSKSTWLFDSRREDRAEASRSGQGSQEAEIGVSKKARVE